MCAFPLLARFLPHSGKIYIRASRSHALGAVCLLASLWKVPSLLDTRLTGALGEKMFSEEYSNQGRKEVTMFSLTNS
jgi:hypothetical protein